MLSVWLFNTPMEMRVYMFSLNTLLYMATSIIGVVLVHIALDNISKFLKVGLLKDRFNFENESFEQCKDLQTNDYSVNIPMRYYYKGKFRKGWVNIVNPFRGTWVVGTPGSGKISPSSNHSSDSTVRKALRSYCTTISFRHLRRSCITIM